MSDEKFVVQIGYVILPIVTYILIIIAENEGVYRPVQLFSFLPRYNVSSFYKICLSSRRNKVRI